MRRLIKLGNGTVRRTLCMCIDFVLILFPTKLGGMSGEDRLPINRGFNSSLGYLSGAEDVIFECAFIVVFDVRTYVTCPLCPRPHTAPIPRLAPVAL